jgi:hypothetical protein
VLGASEASERESDGVPPQKEEKRGALGVQRAARIRHTRISRPASKVRRKRQLPSLRLVLAYIVEDYLHI